MARRTGERLSAAMGFGADGSVDEEESGSETWLCRSTVCANEEEDSDSSDTEECGWSALHTPAPVNVRGTTKKLAETKAGEDTEVSAGKEVKRVPSTSQIQNGKRKLPSLRGFSKSEALRAQLPRTAIKQTELVRGRISQKNGAMSKKSGLRGARSAGYETSPSKDEAEANRRKWDLERRLQDKRRVGAPTGTINEQGKNRNSSRRLPLLNPVAPSVSDVKENRRKWDLERRLQDSEINCDSVGMKDVSERKRDLKRKLPMLNPIVPSVAEAEENRRKWDLEMKLQDSKRCGSVGVINVHERHLDSERKLPALNPVAPSVSGAEENRQKWAMEKKLPDTERGCISTGMISVEDGKQSLKKTLPAFAVEVRQQKWELARRLQGFGACLRCNFQKRRSDNVDKKLQPCPASRNPSPTGGRRQVGDAFQISTSLIYLLLFSSTAVLHCAILNFSSELRQFLRLDKYSVSLLVLVSWVFVGLIGFVGGIVGDVVQDRVRLLHRIVIVWGIAVVAFHIAAYQSFSLVSSVGLASGVLCAGVGHGFLSPNVVALKVQSNLSSFETIPTPLPSDDEDEDENEDCEDGDEDSSSSGSSSEEDSSAEMSYSSDETDELPKQQRQECDLASHNFFSGCFAAKVAGSTFMQGYYILVVDVNAFTEEGSLATVAAQGFHCMLFMSLLLMASLVYFCFQSWDYRLSGLQEKCSYPCLDSGEQKFDRKLASLERGFAASAEILLTWRWKSLFRLCNRSLVGFVLLVFVLMTLIGISLSLVVMLLMSQASLSLRLVAFLLVVFGWLLSMAASSRQLNPKKRGLIRECRRLGLRSRHLYLALFAIAFLCVSGCVAFLRAQLNSTMVVQVCQTRLVIPGTNNILFDPELLGTTVGTSSLFFLALGRVFSRRSSTGFASPRSPLAKASLFAQETPTTPIPKSRAHSLSLQLLPRTASCSPVTRMCFAVLLYLISVFLLSVVELYRRKSGVTSSSAPRSCGNVHSEFSFLLILPHLVLLGASDALFRVSLQEECHELARYTFAPVIFSTNSSLEARRWAGTVQGVILLAEAMGYTTALALTAVLTEWLFYPEPTDMALLFLLFTAIVALTYALLKRIAARAKAHHHYYRPASCHSRSVVSG